MCLNTASSRLMAAATAVGLLVCAQTAVAAEKPQAGQPSSSALSAFSTGMLTIGYLSPAFGSVTLGVSPATRSLGSGVATGMAQAFDVGGRYSTTLPVGRIGIFGAYDERASLLSLAPATSWNFGASVGYAGFYVQGGVNATAPLGPLLGIQGLQAGFGYEIGSFDVRLTYLASQGLGLADRDIDSRQLMLGGIYQITPRIRVNADAFYGSMDTHGAALAVQSPIATPPGTGARVGVELRF
jgi:hypothetical protein